MDIPQSVLTVCHQCNKADTIERMEERKVLLGDGRGNRCIMPQSPCNLMNDKGPAAMMEITFLKVGKRCINVSNIGWTEAGGDSDKRWIDLIFSNHQKLRLENQDAEKFMHFLEGHSTTLL